MPRKSTTVCQSFQILAGATDTDTIAVPVPCSGATLVQYSCNQVVAGVGTGTVAMFLKAGTVTISDTIAAIDADSAAGTLHGVKDGFTGTIVVDGDSLKVSTIKTGSVTTGPTLGFTLLWRL